MLAIVSLQMAHVIVPAAFFLTTVVVSALLREAVESRAAPINQWITEKPREAG